MDGLGTEPCKYLREHSRGENGEPGYTEGKARRPAKLWWHNQGESTGVAGRWGRSGNASRGSRPHSCVVHPKGTWIFFQVNRQRDSNSEVTQLDFHFNGIIPTAMQE